MFQKKALWQGLSFVFAFLLSFAVIAALILESFRSAVDGAFGELSEVMVSSDDGTLWTAYPPPKDVLTADGKGDSKALITKAIDLGRRQEAEGVVLLKNDGTLPLAKGSKVTLLGARSQTSIINSGMGQKSIGHYITLAQALSGTNESKTDFYNTRLPNVDRTGKDLSLGYNKITEFNFSNLKYGGDGFTAGAGFQVNPTVLAKYKELNTASGIQLQPRIGTANSTIINYDPLEPARSAVEPSVTESIASYGDAAIVVVGRQAGEQTDYIKGDVKEGLGFTEPLQLSKNERDIIDLACEKFSKVVVLLNNTSAIEIGDLKKNPKVSAILYVGHPGNYGFLGVADVLCGNVSPSGGLYDIYATNNLSAPAMENMGSYTYGNASEIPERTHYSKNDVNYVMELEGLYTGYRYYETRYYDSIVNPTSSKATSKTGAKASTGNWNYGEEVAYGFGYGMTYSTLKYELVGGPKITQKAHEIYADFTVKVTNTGKVATKANVQIYGQAPYTEYDKTNKVEKSAIQLLAFDKTQVLAAGASETLNITVDMQNLASYDSTFTNADGSKGCWIIENGDYYFAVGNGAHDALNNVMALQNYTPDVAGSKDLARKWTYKYADASKTVDGATFGISRTNTQIQNQIPYADWNWSEYGGEKVTYLSRSDWEGTYPTERKNVIAPAKMIPYLAGKYYDLKKNDDVSDIKWDSTATKHKFFQMVGADFDDPRWEELVSQISLKQATVFSILAGPTLLDLDGVGFEKAVLTDNAGNGIPFAMSATQVPGAPWAIGKEDPNADWFGQVFGCAPIVASTFNPDIMKEIGEFVAVEAIFMGQPIIWGPGLNTHRHAYNGRNGEYYSEDPVLSGVCAMEFAVGARDNGLIAAAKHFVFNDQESHRIGVAPFLTEQRSREIELRAYQIAVEAVKYNTYNAESETVRTKKTGLYGIMTSFSKVGAVEVCASEGMVTNILQKEWGFTGYAVTDIYDDFDIFPAVLNSGVTGYDIRGASDEASLYKTLAGFGGAYLNADTTPTLIAGDKNLQLKARSVVKRTLWALAHSNLMNRYNSTTRVESRITTWRAMYISMLVVFGALAAAAVTMYVLSEIKSRKGA